MNRNGRWWRVPLLAVVASVAVWSCGGAKEESADTDHPQTPAEQWEATHFTLDPDASPYFGRVPFTVKFSAETKNAKGKVSLEWKFGDGSEPSTDPAPTHTFATAGLYTVNVAAKDESGEEDFNNLIVRALTEEQAKAMQKQYDDQGVDFKVP